MKKLFYGFFMCQSMFCAIPCPCRVWDEEARDTMLQCLPVVGLEIGLLWCFLGWVCRCLGMQPLLFGLLMGAYPFVATGYIHLDGYMDVTDAVKSCRSLERRREILKDSHVGSFAVIGCVLLLLGQFVCSTVMMEKDLRILILIPAVSRCCSVSAVLLLPKMSTSQYAASNRRAAFVPLGMLAFFLGIGFLFLGKYGFVLLAECAVFGWALHRAYRSLEGMNGDISGYSLSFGELAAVAALALI